MKTLLSIIIGCSLLCVACGENEAIYYEGEPDGTSGIYFAYYSGMSYSADGSVTYHYDDTTADRSMVSVAGEYMTMSIPVRLFGEVADTDRPFVVKAIGGTVKEGEDFFLPEELVMPGGEASASLQVKIKKTEALQDGAIRYITLGLEENEYFKPYIPTRLVGRDTISTQQITLRYSMVFEEPWTWEWDCLDYLGKYSHAKLNFILDLMGWSYSEFDNKNLYSIAPTLAMFAQIELQKRADEGNPVREADGSLMQLAGDYLVDYSAYE